MQVRGLQAIDKRSAAARALLTWRKELVEDLGGEEACSAGQLVMVDQVTRLRLYLDHVDAWIMEQPSLINKNRRCILPIVRERTQLADSLARYLQALGLERRQRPVIDLGTYLDGRYPEKPGFLSIAKTPSESSGASGAPAVGRSDGPDAPPPTLEAAQ